MSIRLPFRQIEPTFFAGLFDDPLLLVRLRSAGQNLLFDCGQVHHLAKRAITALRAIFVSHAHMDHWMGIDSIIRHLHAGPRRVEIFGPPGLADKFAHKLAAYDWNLAEDYWADFRVLEIHPERLESNLFIGAQSFERIDEEPRELREDRLIFRTPQVEVRAAGCSHRVPSIAYRLDERPLFCVDREKIIAAGLMPGPWLGEMKKHFLERQTGAAEIRLTTKNKSEIIFAGIDDFMARFSPPQQAASLGYISDIAFSEENRRVLNEFLVGVDLLACECTFLRDDVEKARTSSHLCSADLNRLLKELRPRYCVPMHLSKTYSRRVNELYAEIESPSGTGILRLPPRRTPRPLKADEIDWQL